MENEQKPPTNVLLEPISLQALNDYLHWFNDPDVREYLSPGTPALIETIESWITGLTANSSNRYFSIMIEGKNVGHVGLKNIDEIKQIAEIGIVIGEKELWNQGVGKKALEAIKNFAQQTFGSITLEAEINPDNQASRALFKAMGFVEMGEKNDKVLVSCKL